MTRKRHAHKRMHTQKGKTTIRTKGMDKQDGTIHLFDLSGGTRIETDEQLEAAMKDKPTSKPASPAECNSRYIRNELELLKDLKWDYAISGGAIKTIEANLLAMCSNEVLTAIKQGLVTPAFHIPEDKLNLALSGLDEEPV